MDHSDNDQEYILSGEASARVIRDILAREGVDIAKGAFVMDWGCAAGRVLRHFAPEAWHGEFWGVDQHGPSIFWARDNLAPPFRFLTCTACPHLPFEDNTFNVVYGLSVFTHIVDLLDMWLMEFRRVLAPGGYALFTVHDEHTWRLLQTHEEVRRFWIESGYIRIEDLNRDLDDITVVSLSACGGLWNAIVTFFRSDWIVREWGQYLDVVSVEPGIEGYQSMVVLRKP